MQISFEDLYGEDKSKAIHYFLLWVNEWLVGYEIESVTIDPEKAFSFVSNLRRSEFPAAGGFERASPFKKAANLYVFLHNLNPFVGSLPESAVGAEVARFGHSTASLIGFSMVKSCLHGAHLEKAAQTVRIEQPISVSKHFLLDLIEASGGLTPADHFRVFSLLFEALVYDANPDLSYERIV